MPSTMSVILTGCLYKKKDLKELLIRLIKYASIWATMKKLNLLKIHILY